jgi:glycosyl transferase, family 25
MAVNFEYLNTFFDKIYVLCLPRITNRIEHIKKNLSGLNYELFEGVDKQTVSVEGLKESGEYSTARYHEFYKDSKDMPLGMLCCAIGHVKIYEAIIKNGYNKTLILEDDVVPIEDTLSSFYAIAAELPTNWELLYLGYEKNEVYGMSQKIKKILYQAFPPYKKLKVSRKMYRKYYPEDLSTHIAKAGFHDCTHAYCVTLEGAKKILSQQQPVAYYSDNLLAVLTCKSLLKAYIAKPKLFNQLSAFVNEMSSLTSD